MLPEKLMYFEKKVLCVEKNIHVDWLHNLHPTS